MHIETLESAIDHFVATDDIDRIHDSIHHGRFIGVPYNETEWTRAYIFYCCVYTVMENLAEK